LTQTINNNTDMKKTENGLVIVNQEQALKILTTKNTKKGITLLGNVGIGKSHLFKQVFFDASKGTSNYNMIPPMYTANAISAIYNSEGMEGIQKRFKYQLEGRQALVIDDIGTEVVSSNYGIKLDIIEWLILECYAADSTIYVTSNLTLDALTKRYGTRVIDRLKEKTFIIVLEGNSFREKSYNNTETEIEQLLNTPEEIKVETKVNEYSELLEDLDI
jgi:DNA replication protein DnaC